MRVAFVSWQSLEGLNTGYKRRVHSLASSLPGIDVTVISPPPELSAPFRHVTVAPSHVSSSPPLSGAPLLAYRFPSGRSRLRATLQKISPTIVHSEGIWPFPAVRDFARRAGASLVVTIHNLEHVVAGRSNRGLLATRALRRLEEATYRQADLLVCMSDTDRRYLQRDMRIAGVEIVVVPNGTALPERHEHEGPRPLLHGISGPYILFMGKLDYRPNADALRFFLDEVHPLVRRSVPDAVLVVVGSPRPSGLPAGVVAVGAVPSVWPYLSLAHVCVAPLLSGSGTRLKILEYMAAGRAVVSTTIGIEGLDVVPGRDVLVADDAVSFGRAVLRLLESPEEAFRIGTNGRQLVQRRYLWGGIGRRYADYLKERFGSRR